MKQVFISLLNYNGQESTLECLNSLKKIKSDNFITKILVVDNGSSGNSLNKISELTRQYQNLIIFKNKENLGFSGGHNVAIKHALENHADYILILNNDTYVDSDFLNELFDVAEENADYGILSPKIYFAPGSEFHKDRYIKKDLGKVFWYAGGEMDWKNLIGHHKGVDEVDNGQYDKMGETELATGCCMLIRREVFQKVGHLDDKYFLYYEDADYSMRAKKKGFRIIYVPKSKIWHKNAESSGGSGSDLQDYYITRNRLVFGFRYASIRTKLALAKESLLLFLKGRKWQRIGVIDYYLDNLGKGSFNQK
jgi:GT2 family glycosyltransferase